VTVVLLLLFITSLSSLLSRVVRLPLPLLQIALGVGAGLLGMHVSFEPDVFMLLFIPPLLFFDAYQMPMREFRELRRIILMLALGLVLFTTIGCGYFIHWLLPHLSLAACFALAAVLSPTDAVAVGGMIEGRSVPHRFMHILSGEALLNDASGLVCFKFASLAAVTGAFSFKAATAGFLLMSVGGVATGFLLAFAFSLVERYLLRQRLEHTPTVVTISSLLPFAAYLAAEHLGASGILAAVAAGITVRERRVFGGLTPETRIGGVAVWNMLIFAFNGMIFLLLGLQLPALLRGGVALAQENNHSPWLLAGVIALISVALVLLRFVWVVISLLVRMLRSRLRRVRETLPSPRLIVAMSLAGVRGAITLAAVLSLDVDFPQRDLLVTLAAGVIVASLVTAAILLPPVLSGLDTPDVDPMAAEADAARLSLARASVELVAAEARAVDAEGEEDRQVVMSRLLADMRTRVQRLSVGLEDDENAEDGDRDQRLSVLRQQRLETSLRLRILRSERDILAEMRSSGRINDDTERLLLRDLDIEEEALQVAARTLPRPAVIEAAAAEAEIG